MSTFQSVTILGYVGRDPEIRYMQSGQAIANFSMATTDKWKDKQTGEAKERTEWHHIDVFGNLATIVGQYVKKGSLVLVQGQLRTEEWDDKNTGQKRSRVKIRASEVRFVNTQQSEGAPQRAQPPQRSGPRQAAPQQRSLVPEPDGVDENEDIPF